jgi:methyl-accepting chemotaxis protein
MFQADGSCAIDTKLVGLPMMPLSRGSYRGGKNTDVPYFTAYDPIKNSKGEVVGVLYVGVKESDFCRLQQLQTVMVIAGGRWSFF